MNTKEPHFGVKENISTNVIFINGISRCGKSLLSNIISTFSRTEQLQFINLLENIVPALSMGVVDKGYAKSVMRAWMNELAYNQMISRNVNFRAADWTGIPNHPDEKIYFDRLSKEDGDSVVTELRKNNRFFPYMTHDMMVNLEHLNILEIDYKMLHIYRHPVDNVYSWFMRGLGDRYGNDPRLFTLSIDYNGEVLPWYCSGYEEEWLRLQPMERCVRTVIDLIEKSLNQYKKTANPERIHLLTYEDLAQNTEEEMQGISNFLHSSTTVATLDYIKKAGCPRVLSTSDRMKKRQELKAGISNELFIKLSELSERYENGVYGLRI